MSLVFLYADAMFSAPQQLESFSAARTRSGEVARGVNPPQKQRLQFLYRLEPGLKALANP